MDKVRIYLSGSIRKGDQDPRPESHFWTSANIEYLRLILPADVELLDPGDSRLSRRNYRENYVRDLTMLASSQIMIADLRERRGIGIGAELMASQYENIIVIGWLPNDSHYCRKSMVNVYGENLTDWIHPFVFGLCDYLEESLEDVARRAKRLIELGEPLIKKTESMDVILKRRT